MYAVKVKYINITNTVTILRSIVNNSKLCVFIFVVSIHKQVIFNSF